MNQFPKKIIKISDDDLMDVAGGRSEIYYKPLDERNNYVCSKCGFKLDEQGKKHIELKSNDWICPGCKVKNTIIG